MNARESALKTELSAFLASEGVGLPDDFDQDTPLISSGELDSLVLFNLLTWIESKTGAPIDPATVDVRATLDSIRLIAAFIENRTGHAGVAASRRPTAREHGYRIERYAAADADVVAELQTGLLHPGTDVNRRYIQWKYHDNPYAHEPVIYLAFAGGEPVGMRGFYASRWQIGAGGCVADVPVADDLVVRREHRNRGVIDAIMRRAIDDFHRQGTRFVFNLSGAPLTVLSSLAAGWRQVALMHPLGRATRSHALRERCRRIVRRTPLLWRLGTSAQHSARTLDPFARLDRCTRHASRRGGVVVEIAREPRLHEMAALVARHGHDGRIRHLRDANFLDWRLRNPLNEYRFLYLGDTTLRAYLVLKWTRYAFVPNPRVTVVDWEVSDTGDFDHLLEAALAAGWFSELVAWSGDVADSLVRHGFRPVDQDRVARGSPSILVRACDPALAPQDWVLNAAPLLDARCWDMRMLYSMAG